MVDIYINNKKEPIDVNIWSLVKANIYASLIVTGIILGAIVVLLIIFGLMDMAYNFIN